MSQTIDYASSVDGTSPLRADVDFKADGRAKPVVLVMHGYSGRRHDVARDIVELSKQGLFAVAPDMRGRGDSAGVWDSSGLDVHDAIDAAHAAIAQFPGEVDRNNINIVGYSGGGANAIAAGCRFPDLFNNAVCFFGITDYASWYRSTGRPDCNRIMDKVLGTPEAQPARYEARDMNPAAGNARKTRFWIFWDEKETACPSAACTEPWIALRRQAGLDVEVRMSKETDALRWLHGYRTNHDSLSHADALFVPSLKQAREVALPRQGELAVPGYVVTKHFRVFVGGGTEGRVRIRYNLDATPKVQVIDNPRQLSVTIHEEK